MENSYYCKLSRPNNEFGRYGKIIYESQLNKTFNQFLLAECLSLTQTQREKCYVDIVFDVASAPEKPRINNVKFNFLSTDPDLDKSFKETIEKYYRVNFNEMTVEKALSFISRVAPTADRYYSWNPSCKVKDSNDSAILNADVKGNDITIRYRFDDFIQISKDEEGRNVIEIGVNDECASTFKGYLDDFEQLIYRSTLANYKQYNEYIRE